MRILVYKRTHTGDPGLEGIFGVNGCMGRIRNLAFDAVIGIGSLRPWHDSIEIAGRINWVGISPVEVGHDGRGRQLQFAKFRLFEGAGPRVSDVAPSLAEYYYGRNPRFVMDGLGEQQRREAEKILAEFEGYPAPDRIRFGDTTRYPRGARTNGCGSCNVDRVMPSASEKAKAIRC